MLISQASKIMLKIPQAKLQQYVNRELPDIEARFRTGPGTRDQIANICWIIEKAREFQRNIYFWFIDSTKDFDSVDQKNWEKFFKRWEYQTTWPASWDTCMQVKKQRLELDVEQQIGSNLEKKYAKTLCCHPAYLTSMQSTICEILMPGWMNHKLRIKIAGRNINNLRYANDTTRMAQIKED